MGYNAINPNKTSSNFLRTYSAAKFCVRNSTVPSINDSNYNCLNTASINNCPEAFRKFLVILIIVYIFV